MTAYWWVDRALPGIVGALIVATVMAVSHVLLRREFRKTTDQQTAQLTSAEPKAKGDDADAHGLRRD